MTDEPTEPDLQVAETFTVASEFAPNVTLTEETFFGHGWQPLTVSFLAALWFLPTDASFDVPFLVDWFKQLGWKSANGKSLGPDAIRRELGLLREAGYIQVNRLRGEGGRAVGIQYSISKRRVDQPQDGPWIPAISDETETRRSHHVPPMTTRGGQPHVVDEGNRRSHHVPPITGRGGQPHVVNAAKDQVAPRASNGVSPHTPRREGGTTFPLPPTEKTEGATASPEELATAVEFLMRLPGSWARSKPQADKLAPDLIRQAAAMGWDLDTALRLWLLRNEPGKKPVENFNSTLKWRIDNLVYREAAMTAVAEPQPAGTPAAGTGATPQPAAGGIPAWCGKCGDSNRAAQFNPRFRTNTGTATGIPCPDCHPTSTPAGQN